jgi:Eukaryotic initiation factor 4E
MSNITSLPKKIHDHDNKNDHHHDLSEKTVTNQPQLNSKSLRLQVPWNYYYHLPNDKNWNIDSYKLIMENISTLEQLIELNEKITDNIIKNCMLFIMRKGITPMWEDSHNRLGGSFSYKVTNKVVVQVWRKLMYLLCGYSLTIDPLHMDLVNGITISPKRGFCIIKIWMKNCTLQDPAIIINIDNLLRNGCLFKAHNPEF